MPKGGGGGAGGNVISMMQGRVPTGSSMNHFMPRESISSGFTVLQRQQNSESGAPSTTVRSLRELQWSPSPAIAGADGASDLILATRLRPRFADQSHQAFASNK